MNSSSYQKELTFAKDLARVSGDMIRKGFTLGMKKEWKEDNSPVTDTDNAINQFVIEQVKKQFPEHSILGEEGTHRIKGSSYAWLCDPIDGTIPFSHGAPNCMFLLALVEQEHGQPVVGVMYDPFMNRLLHAVKGEGAFLNDKPITVSTARTFRAKCFEVSYRDSLHGKPNMLRYEIAKRGGKIANFCCVGYGEMLTACGEFAATIFGYNKPYDVAAAKVIIEEAGGKVTDIFGNEQRYDKQVKGCVMSNGHLHDELVELTAAIGETMNSKVTDNIL